MTPLSPTEGEPPCPTCGGRGWHTAGGNDPAACGACSAGESWHDGVTLVEAWVCDQPPLGQQYQVMRDEWIQQSTRTLRLIFEIRLPGERRPAG